MQTTDNPSILDAFANVSFAGFEQQLAPDQADTQNGETTEAQNGNTMPVRERRSANSNVRGIRGRAANDRQTLDTPSAHANTTNITINFGNAGEDPTPGRPNAQSREARRARNSNVANTRRERSAVRNINVVEVQYREPDIRNQADTQAGAREPQNRDLQIAQPRDAARARSRYSMEEGHNESIQALLEQSVIALMESYQRSEVEINDMIYIAVRIGYEYGATDDERGRQVQLREDVQRQSTTEQQPAQDRQQRGMTGNGGGGESSRRRNTSLSNPEQRNLDRDEYRRWATTRQQRQGRAQHDGPDRQRRHHDQDDDHERRHRDQDDTDDGDRR